MGVYNQKAYEGHKKWCAANPERAAAHKRNWYLKNRDRLAAEDKVAYEEEREWFHALKNAPCKDCEEMFPPCCMDFDHVRGEKKYLVSQMMVKKMAKETILAEIAKCDLICANCHRIRTWVTRRPTKLGGPRRWAEEKEKMS